jgi:hypothetical protein
MNVSQIHNSMHTYIENFHDVKNLNYICTKLYIFAKNTISIFNSNLKC